MDIKISVWLNQYAVVTEMEGIPFVCAGLKVVTSDAMIAA